MGHTREKKGLEILTLILKILISVAYIAITIFLGFVEVNAISSTINNSGAGEGGWAFALVVILLGSMAYGAVIFVDLIGFIISLFNKYSEKRKKHITFFGLFLIIPVLTELLLILIWTILV